MNNMKTHKVWLFAAITAVACTKEEKTISTNYSQSTSTQSSTTVTLSVIDSEGSIKVGYHVLMFNSKVKLNQPIGPIQMEVISDENGIATFDLDGYITNVPDSVFFEACTKQGNNYVVESITHPGFLVEKGHKITSGIMVK